MFLGYKAVSEEFGIAFAAFPGSPEGPAQGYLRMPYRLRVCISPWGLFNFDSVFNRCF